MAIGLEAHPGPKSLAYGIALQYVQAEIGRAPENGLPQQAKSLASQAKLPVCRLYIKLAHMDVKAAVRFRLFGPVETLSKRSRIPL